MISESKEEIRKKLLHWRNSLSLDERVKLSEQIIKNIFDLDAYHHANVLFLYYPLGQEVDILPIMKQGLMDKKIIALPKVVNKTTIQFNQVSSMEDVLLGTYNVYEPKSSIEVPYTKNSLILVPGIAFDKQMHRIGFGAGYYDRYFNKLINEYPDLTINSIGVCYEKQFVETTYPTTYDVALNGLVTNNGYYSKASLL